MDTADQPIKTSTSTPKKNVTWDNDVSISELMEDLFLQMNTKKDLKKG
jgi:hypothetical protein